LLRWLQRIVRSRAMMFEKKERTLFEKKEKRMQWRNQMTAELEYRVLQVFNLPWYCSRTQKFG
jgi:hypothetical protein